MTSSRPRRSAAAAAAASAGAYTPKDSDFEEEDDEEQLVTYTQTQKAPAKNQGSPKDDDGDDSTMPIGFLFGRFGPSLLERLMADEGITSFSEVVSTSATPASSVTPTPVKRVRGPRLVVKEEDLRRSSRHTSTNKRQHSESRGSGDDESDYAPERKSYRTGTGHGRTGPATELDEETGKITGKQSELSHLFLPHPLIRDRTILARHGHVPFNPIGSLYPSRPAASKCGVHGPPVGGIAGTEESGAVSICDNSGYDGGQESDNDGNVIEYCGSGGRDLSGNKRVADQTKDQQLTGFNLVLANAVDLGLPVRVLRGSKSKSRYRPAPGHFRYEGLYTVLNYRWETQPSSKKSVKVLVFTLQRRTGQPALSTLPTSFEDPRYGAVLQGILAERGLSESQFRRRQLAARRSLSSATWDAVVRAINSSMGCPSDSEGLSGSDSAAATEDEEGEDEQVVEQEVEVLPALPRPKTRITRTSAAAAAASSSASSNAGTRVDSAVASSSSSSAPSPDLIPPPLPPTIATRSTRATRSSRNTFSIELPTKKATPTKKTIVNNQ